MWCATARYGSRFFSDGATLPPRPAGSDRFRRRASSAPLNGDDAEAQAVGVARVAVAEGRPARLGRAVPAAAADHPVRAGGRPLRVLLRALRVVIRGVRVGAPLPEVA